MRLYRSRFSRHCITPVFTLCLLLSAMSAIADTSRRWNFDVPARYELSDPELIEVDPATGVARLILQPDAFVPSTVEDYLTNSLSVGVSYGPEMTLKLAGAPGSYPYLATFESRVFDGGLGNVWQSVFLNVDNAGYPAVLPATIRQFYPFDNTFQEFVSSTQPTLIRTPEFSSDAAIGTHSAKFKLGDQVYSTSLSEPAMQGFTISLWVKPDVRIDSVEHCWPVYLTHEGGAVILLRFGGTSSRPHFGQIRRSIGLAINGNGNAYSATEEGTFNSLDLSSEWSHVVVVYDNSAPNKTTIYKNGVPLPLATDMATGSLPGISDLYLGGSTRFGYEGLIDGFILWNRALPRAEVEYLYASKYGAYGPVKAQLRSGTTPEDVLTKNFVGSDGTTNTYFYNEGVASSADFNSAHRYAQIRTLMWTSYDYAETPYVRSVALYGSLGAQFDSTFGDFASGLSANGITNIPTRADTPYVALGKASNGGYLTSGTYLSQAFDGGHENAIWSGLSWHRPEALESSFSGLEALYHLDGSWADSSAANGGGLPASVSNPLWSQTPKLGTQAALYNDAVSRQVTGFSFGTIKTVAFWIQAHSHSSGLMAFNATDDVRIENLRLGVGGFAGNRPKIYVNGRQGSRTLLAGWNFVVMEWGSSIDASALRVGLSNAGAFSGLLDELAFFSRSLTGAEIREMHVKARPKVAGVGYVRVRTSETLEGLESAAWTPPFSDPQFAPLPALGRYMQFEVSLASDGRSTPGIGPFEITGDESFSVRTWEDASAGNFVDESTQWMGDRLGAREIAAISPANMYWRNEPNLVGLWHFDEEAWGGGNLVVDYSGWNRHGNAINGAGPSLDAQVGLRSGYFDGTDDYVSLSTVDELSAPSFSAAAWFRSGATNIAPIISTRGVGVRHFSLMLNYDGAAFSPGVVSLVLDDIANGVRTAVSAGAGYNDNEWHHVAGVRAGSYIYLFIDGERVGTTFIGAAYGLMNAAIPLVGKWGSEDHFFQGNIDEVAVWGRDITPSEIGRHFAGGFLTAAQGIHESVPFDAGGRSLWEVLSWSTDGIYGRALDGADVGVGLLVHCETNTPTDASTHAHVLTSAQLQDGGLGTIGSSLYFDGSSASIDAGDHAALESSAFSVEAWINPESISTRSIFDKHSGSAGYSLVIGPDGILRFNLGSAQCQDRMPLLVNQWQHVAATYDGSEMRLYVDGELRDSTVPVGVTVPNSRPLLIGRSAGGGFFRGKMDEIAVWKRALSDIEALDHYRAYAGTLRFQLRWGDELPLATPFTGPDGSPDTYYTTSSGELLQGIVPLAQYLQFRAEMLTEDFRFSPDLHGVRVAAAAYPQSAPTVNPVGAQGLPFVGKLLTFNHDRTYNTNTDVRYQLSGDAGLTNRWYYWNSLSNAWSQSIATNTATMYNAEASRLNEVSAHIDTFYSQVYDKTGGVARFKAFLYSPGDQQIEVDWTEMTASEGRIVVEVPNGEEVGPLAWISAVPYDIEWSWDGNVSDNLAVEYSLNGHTGPWVVISNGVPKGAGNRGSLEWIIPGGSANPEFEGLNSNVLVRIRDLADATIEDTSDDLFEIVQKFKVTQPNGGEYWYIGDTNVIGWESSFDLSTKASIYMAPDGSNFFADAGGYLIDFLATNANSSGENLYPWTTPTDVAALLSTNARILVQEPSPARGRYADESDDVFTMAGIVITAPAEGQKVKRNDPGGFNIEWTAIGAGTNVTIDISLDGGTTFETNLYSNVTNMPGLNSHNWLVTHAETDLAVLRVRSLSDSKVVGVSKVFTIAGVDVLAPDGGEEWLMGSTNTIEWLAGGAGDFVSIYYTPLYEGTNSEWILIESGAPNSLSYQWIVTDRVSPDARVKIVSDEDPNLFSVSDGDFSIAGVRVTYPNLFNDTITMGQDVDMLHDGAPTRWLRVGLEISYDRQATWQYLGPGSDNWTLRQLFRFQPTYPSRQTKVRATVIGATKPDGSSLTNIVDVSDDYFTSAGLVLDEPIAGSTNTLGETYSIKWVTAGAGESATITYSSDETAGDELIIPSVFNDDNYPGNNSYDWTIPATVIPTENATVKVVSGDFTAVSDPFILRGMRLTQPVLGDVWNVGTLHPLTWKYAGVSKQSRGDVSLSLDGGKTYPFDLQTDYDLISVPFYTWAIDPDMDPTTNAIVRLKIRNSDIPADIDMEALSDVFTLRGIKILGPLDGDVVLLGSTNQIQFIAADAGATATILYSSDGGASFDPNPIAANTQIINGTNTFAWGVENDRTPSTNAVIRIVGSNGETKTSGTFALGGIRVDRPLEFDIWAVGEDNLVSYISVGTLGVADLHLLYEDGFSHEVNGGAPLSGPTDGTATELSTWSLPASAARGQQIVSNVVLRVQDRQGLVGFSRPFKIVSQPLIEIVSPLEGDYLKVGDDVEITWVKGGHMEAEDFRVFYSRDGFATMSEIYRDVTFNASNNTFVMPWLLEDRLGTAQLLVSNKINSAVHDYSGVFDIVGALELSYPNGDPGDSAIYAKSTIQAKWWTLGSVKEVNLFYKTATNNWTLVNSTPIANKGGPAREQTTYQLTVPNVITDSLKFRVQDASYGQTFDGVTPGPYDDSDNAFAVGYFTVLWEVGYFDDDGVFRYMDQLSVTDSSGWSVSGLSSVDEDGQPVQIAREYPYGVYDTVWYRQFFNDKVDFRWLCDSNQTRRVEMEPSDTEPDAHVLADFVYDPGTNKTLTVHAWIERGGRVLHNPDSATVYIYDTDGSELRKLHSEHVLADGFFRMVWNNVLDTLTEGETYLARVEVEYNKVTFSAAVTYTLSLAAADKQLDDLRDQVSAFENTLTNQVGELTDLSTNFHAKALGRLDSITGRVDRIDVGISNVVTEIGSFSNSVVRPLSDLTNMMVDVIAPSLTNVSATVSNISDNTSGDAARILNRPTTVEFGSTNTILYKTTRSLDSGTVRVREESTGSEFVMSEVTAGIGIYGYDLIADWGIGSFTITCSDPNASDSLVLEVISAGGGVSTIAESIADLESEVSSMSSVLDSLNTSGLSSLLDSIGSEISQVESAVASAVSGGGGGAAAAGAVGQLETLISGGGGDSDAGLLGQLVSMSSQLEQIYGNASTASKFALSAKNEAGAAATGVQELKALITGGADASETKAKLSAIKSAIDTANSSISDIPKAVGATALHAQIGEVAKQISDLASREGFEYEVGLAAPGGEGGDAADEEMITVLNQNMSEMKISLEFMQKILDEKINEPVIQEDWVGVP